jgi:hypothetical protein
VRAKERGERAGVLRAGLAAADLPRMLAMLYSVLWTMDTGSDGWRLYVALMLDAISAGERRLLPRWPCASSPIRAAGRCKAALHLRRRYLIVTISRFARKLLRWSVTS